MRLLHIIHSVDPRGGGPIEAIKILSKAHLARGRTIEVASMDSPDASWVKDFPLTLHCLGPSFGKYGYAGALPKWLRKNAQKYQAIVVNGVWQYPSYGTYKALQSLGKNYFLFTHGMLDPWFERAYPFKHIKKVFYWMLAERHVLASAKAVLFTCEEEKLQARKSFPFYRCTERVVNYASGEPPHDLFALGASFLKRHPELIPGRYLLFLGRVNPKKAVDLLLRAYANMMSQNHPLSRLVIAGPFVSARYETEIRSLAQQLGISEHITWTGMLDSNLKWGALASAEAFILPSHQENFGLAVAEALACGVPVLISDKVNIWREIIQDKAGFVAPDTLEGTIELLTRWNSGASHHAMRDSARQCYQNRYRPEIAADGLIKVIESFDTVSS